MINEALLTSTPQLKMLYGVYQNIENGDPLEAFIAIKDFIALEGGVDGSILSTEMSSLECLYDLMDLELLKRDPWDWLGLLHNGIGLDNNPQFSRGYIEHTAQQCLMNIMDDHGGLPKSIFDRFAGTGTFLIACYRLAGDNITYFGAEDNLLKYQSAIAQTHLYKIPAFITAVRDDDMGYDVHSPIWDQANVWRPERKRKKERGRFNG